MADLELLDFAEFMAFEARKQITPHFREEIDIESKEDNTPVTIADKKAEEEIRKLISMNYPGHGIYGEEMGGSGLDAEYVWVIDPIDGTKSFIAGRPIFGTLIALLHNKKPILGVIDQPILDEVWTGYEGQAKFRDKDGVREIKANGCIEIGEAFFCLHKFGYV